jgi:hypothetical protein
MMSNRLGRICKERVATQLDFVSGYLLGILRRYTTNLTAVGIPVEI